MGIFNWLRGLKRTRKAHRLTRPSAPRFTPMLERLERRDVPAPASSLPFALAVNANGTLFVNADDGVHGRELWTSDGTEAGTVLLKDINPGSGNSFPGGLTNFDGAMLFQANDGAHGGELWKSDGTQAGTILLKDINAGGGNSFPNEMTIVNGTVYFRADDGVHGQELWKSDGTAAGTTLVKDINPGSSGGIAFALRNVNGTLYFVANDGVHGQELWKSDGTEAGTVLVKDICAGSNGSFPSELKNLNGTIYITANDGIHGLELWKSDGTAEGTVLVKDINPNSSGSILFAPTDLTVVNGTLFFQADDGVHGRELWKSDGTAAGTALVKDIIPGSTNSIIINPMLGADGILFFMANDGVHGNELWKSDGTEAGTVLVKDIFAGPADSANFPPTSFNGEVYLLANDGVHGRELWKSDGTEAGTVLVKDINAGGLNTSVTLPLTNVNGTLFFGADESIHGFELWKSNGTEAGTVLVKDINPIGTLHSQTLRADFAQTTETLALRIDVLANDSFAAGVSGSITAVSAPAHGSAGLNADGTITYTSVAGFSGIDFFTYSVTNTLGEVDTATVRVEVFPQDFLRDDHAQTSQGTPVTIFVRDNDGFTPGEAVTAVSTPSGGSAVLNDDGTITYTPAAGFFGTDTFTYTVSNAVGGVDTSTVTVQVIQRVQIDIKPGSTTNAINLNNDGTISVALFSSAIFDATTVDIGSVQFAGTSVYEWSLQDVNHDGSLDLMLQFRIDATNLREVYLQLLLDDYFADGNLDATRQQATLLLSGTTTDGNLWEGLDSASLFESGNALKDLLIALGLK